MATIINADTSDGLKLTSDTSGQLELQSAGSTKVTMDATGNVGIGTSSPTSKLQVNGASILGSPATFYVGDDGGSLGAFLNQTAALPIRFNTSGVERMRINSSGGLLIGQTADPFPGVGNTVVGAGITGTGRLAFSADDLVSGYFNRNTSNGQLIRFSRQGTAVGGIDVTTTATTYVTSSDYRLKENVAPMSGSIDRLKQLKPSTWSWKVDGSHGEGFLAHEAQTVVPEAVGGTKDAMRTEEYEVTPAVLDDDGNVVTEAVMGTREVPDYQGIDQSKLVPLLTAALQEAIQRIEALEAK
jgi:hypothetical protein